VPIFYDNMTYILRNEIPKYTLSYIDDVLIRGPKTRYELMGGRVETLDQNPGIRRFVFVTNFIWSYFHQYFDNSHDLKSYGKPSKKPFN